MKTHLVHLVTEAVNELIQNNELSTQTPVINIEHTRDSDHGDFACNIALALAKSEKRNPRELAELIKSHIPDSSKIQKIEIAGPGFINFFLVPNANQSVVLDILEAKHHYGDSSLGAGTSVLIEFVSANPTGPLHIGHGRGAAYGAAVANLLRKAGFKVDCEYYVNDAGRQMDILAISTWFRYLELNGINLDFPVRAYQGEYVSDIANDLYAEHGDKFLPGGKLQIFEELDDEAQLDNIIQFARAQLGDTDYLTIHDAALDHILNDIKQDLTRFGVEYQNWFSERTLVNSDILKQYIQILDDNNYCYRQDGAIWFRSSDLGDEKDRVLIRENGQPTYFASDIAYHISKYDRGYDKFIDIWGADHHGYIARVRAAMQALGKPVDDLDILLVQFATLYRGKEKIQMSTRSGQFVTLQELYEEVGIDATRFFYIMRKCEQHLDFDLELAKSKSNENPVYYIQYAHARICSVMRQFNEKGHHYKQLTDLNELDLLTETHEQNLLSRLVRYQGIIESAATQFEPHQLAYYLRDLANDFHSYYNSHQFLVEVEHIRNARISLINATRIIIENGLSLLGVSAPEEM